MRYYYTHDRSNRWHVCQGTSLLAAKQEATRAMYTAGATECRIARDPGEGDLADRVPVAYRRLSGKWEPAF